MSWFEISRQNTAPLSAAVDAIVAAERARIYQNAVAISDAAREVIREDGEAHLALFIASHALQLHAWHELEQTGGRDSPREIREALKVEDAHARKLLRYVGEEAYRAAGGRFELDLFADEAEERGSVVDEGLLQQLADAQLDAERAAVRDLCRRPELRFVAAPPQNDFRQIDWQLQVQPKLNDLGGVALPDGAIVACMEIDEEGEASTTYWWESRKAKFGAGTASQPAAVETSVPGERLTIEKQAAAIVREQHGVAGDGVQTVMHLRQAMLRALLIADARRGSSVGQHYATWATLRAKLSSDSTRQIGARAINAGYVLASERPSDQTTAILKESHAQNVWDTAIKELAQHSCITEQDLPAAFLDYLGAGDAIHRLAGAVVAGYALERSANTPAYRIPVHDAIAQMAGGTPARVRRIWSPGKAFFGLFPARQLLDIVEPLIAAETWRRWARLRPAELRATIARAFGPSEDGIQATASSKAAEWVHPLLAFEPIDFSKPSSSEPLPLETYIAEAAE